jgi:hypothetical protein
VLQRDFIAPNDDARGLAHHRPSQEKQIMKQLFASAVGLLVVATAFAAEDAAPLQVGDDVSPFYVKDVTGPAAGTALCYRCRYGDRPVVSIFAREVNDELAALLKEVDATVGKNSAKDMAAFLVLLTDDPAGQEEKLKELATAHGLKNVPLTTFEDVGGPRSYKIAKDADFTVMMWVGGKVQVNSTFEKGKLSQQAVAGVVADTAKILN